MKFHLETIPEVHFGIQSLRQAAKLVEEIRRETIVLSLTKNDRSPVTVADFSVQALVARLLAERFPSDPLVAEESADSFKSPGGGQILDAVTRELKKFIPDADPVSVTHWVERGAGNPSGRFWTMDPIDGTKGFLRGEQYAIALALIENGTATLGILACPNLKEGQSPDIGGEGTLAVGIRGQGSWYASLKEPKEFLPLRASSRSSPSEAILLRSVENSHTDSGRLKQAMDRLEIVSPPIFMDSLAKFVLVASGKADLLLRLPANPSPQHRECIWDQAPGGVIVEEAGGRVSDFEGRDLDYSQGRMLTASGGILISNGRLHAAALEALKEI